MKPAIKQINISEKRPMYVNQLQGNAFLEDFFVVFRLLTGFAVPEDFFRVVFPGCVFFRVVFRVGVFFRVANRIYPCLLRQAEWLANRVST